MINRQSILLSRKNKLRSLFLIIGCVFVSNMALAEVPVPKVKPAVTNASNVLSTKDAGNFRQGMRAIQLRKWDAAEKYHKRLDDPVAKRVMMWKLALKDPEISFRDLTDVIQNQSDWPRMTGIRAKAEGKLFDRPKSAKTQLIGLSGTNRCLEKAGPRSQTHISS